MASNRDKAAEQEIMRGLLGAVERGDVTQRRLSRELGIAVGLVNAYIKRGINRGLIKVRQVPPRRYAYYLTPKGFLEKSRLVADYFIYSFEFFRRARTSCAETLAQAVADGHRRLALIGASELTEIAAIVASEVEVEIVAVVDPKRANARFLRFNVEGSLADVADRVDAVMITSLSDWRTTDESAVKVFGRSRVYVPKILPDIDRSRQPAPEPERKRA